AVGRSGTFEDSGSVRFWGWWLEVSAEGYQTLRALLPEYTGMGRDIHKATPPPIQIRLIPDGSSQDGPLADLPGGYFTSTTETGSSLWLGSDGPTPGSYAMIPASPQASRRPHGLS